MDPSDIASAFEDRDSGRAIIALRARRRTLESREFKLLSFISGIYAYTAFGLAVLGVALVMSDASRLYGMSLLGLTTFFAFVIFRMWRRKRVSSWLVAAPCVVFLAWSLAVNGWGTPGFWLDAVALAAVALLARTWRRMEALTSPSAVPLNS